MCTLLADYMSEITVVNILVLTFIKLPSYNKEIEILNTFKI